MNCTLCKWKLHPEYIKYKDVEAQPYCQQCYIQIGGVV